MTRSNYDSKQNKFFEEFWTKICTFNKIIILKPSENAR